MGINIYRIDKHLRGGKISSSTKLVQFWNSGRGNGGVDAMEWKHLHIYNIITSKCTKRLKWTSNYCLSLLDFLFIESEVEPLVDGGSPHCLDTTSPHTRPTQTCHWWFFWNANSVAHSSYPIKNKSYCLFPHTNVEWKRSASLRLHP